MLCTVYCLRRPLNLHYICVKLHGIILGAWLCQLSPVVESFPHRWYVLHFSTSILL